MKIAICDDNEGDRARIESALAEYLQQRELVAEVRAFNHPDSLLETVRKEDFDIYLLDILMPMVNGVATARELRSMKGSVPIVFFTTSRDYALEAFGVKAIDYVLKPWSKAAFADAMNAALEAVPKGEAAQWTVKTLTGLRRVRPDRIMYVTTSVEARHVLEFHMDGGEVFEVRGAVVGIREELSQYLSLVTVGKSLLINPSYLCAIDKTQVKLVGGERLNVPKSAIPSLKTAMLAV